MNRTDAVQRALLVAHVFSRGLGVEDRTQHQCPQGKGDNHGQVVEYFLKKAGLTGGYPWCMSFATGTLDEMFSYFEEKSPLPVVAGCQWMYTWAQAQERKQGITLLYDTPQAGDLFLLWRTDVADGPRMGHTGFVVAPQPLGKYTTIEGNSNDKQSREGWGVVRLTRTYKAGDKFLRWPNLLKEA